MLCLAWPVRTSGARMTMNAVGKSHKVPNNRIRPIAFLLVIGLFRPSRIANGSTRTKLMRAAEPIVAVVVFIVFFAVISSTRTQRLPVIGGVKACAAHYLLKRRLHLRMSAFHNLKKKTQGMVTLGQDV